VHYAGDLVSHQGSTWQARIDTGRAPPHADWQCLAKGGRDGVDGRALRIRGTYDPTEIYGALDIVAFNKGSWVAKHDTPGECPGDGWQLLTSYGKRGEQGQRGERGERGLPGERGDPAPMIVSWRIDRESYQVIPRYAHGEEGPAISVRELFEQFVAERGG
jgi:hypothetical protein